MIVLRRTRYLVPRPPLGPVLHAATYLHRSPGWNHARTFSRWNREVEVQLRGTPGALAYSLQRLLFGGEAWTLSMWTNREDMLAFVRSGSHRSASDWLNSAERNVGKFTQWESESLRLDFDEAYRRLGVPPPHRRVLLAPTRVPPDWLAAGE